MPQRKSPPWDKSQYCIDEERKIVWLLGSFMRAMSLHHRTDDPVPGYKVCLCTNDELINKRKEIQDEQEDDYTESYRSFDR